MHIAEPGFLKGVHDKAGSEEDAKELVKRTMEVILPSHTLAAALL